MAERAASTEGDLRASIGEYDRGPSRLNKIANNVEVFGIGSRVNLSFEWVIDVMKLVDNVVGKCSFGKAGVVESLQFLIKSLHLDYEVNCQFRREVRQICIFSIKFRGVGR